MVKPKTLTKGVGQTAESKPVPILEPRDVLATMAHELKTPLTLITGLASMLEAGQFGKLNPKQSRYIERIGSVSDRLLLLIESLLVMSRSQADGHQLDLEPVSVPAVVKAVLAELESELEQSHISIKLLHKRSMAPVLADQESLYQIIYNLVDNATKYSPPRTTITIKYRVEAGALQLRISDEGIGIKPSEIEQLFRRFGKIGRPISAHAGSTGLGLYIVKKLVESQGGTIRAQSLKTGTCFVVVLPVVEQLDLFRRARES